MQSDKAFFSICSDLPECFSPNRIIFVPSVDIDEGGPVSIIALNAINGSKKWQYLSEDGFIKSLYATDTNLAFVGYQDFISSLDIDTGKLLWRKDSGNWVSAISGFDNTIYYGSANTNVHAWDVSNGNSIWKYNIENGSFNYVLDAPIRINDNIFFLSQRGELFVLSANNGKPKIHKQTDITAHVGLSTNGRWVVIGDSTGTVHAYDLSSLPYND